MDKIKICLDDSETRAVWAAALEAKREVASWPAWKRGDDNQPTRSKDMGMANKAPESRYVRRFTISAHALDRFRERVDEDVKCRSNFDVGNLLDEKVKQATDIQTVRDPRAPESITRLHAIEVRSGTYFAVVRDEAVITVLDEAMVKANFQSATWKPALNAPFTREALGAVQVVQPFARKPSPPVPAIASATPEASPLEVAGAVYAQALKLKHDCEQAHELAKAGVQQAEEALQDANDKLTNATKALMNIATGQPPETPLMTPREKE